jgi:hypothetical protein
MLQRIREQRRLEKAAEVQAVADAMRQAEQSKLTMARAFHEKRAHDLLSQAETRMEGTMISPKDKATALERVKGVGEFGLVRQFPSPQTEVPVGSGFVLPSMRPESAVPKPAVMRPEQRYDEYRPSRRMVPPPQPAVQKPGKRFMVQPKTSIIPGERF